MPDALMRLAILAVVGVLLIALVWGGRLFVARQKRLALTAAPPAFAQGKVSILAFSSADCTQCHTLQQPTLPRLQALRVTEIDVMVIDTAASPHLPRGYRILTLPT